MNGESEFTALYGAINDAILLLDGRQIVECNPKTLELFGGTREQIIGLTPVLLSPKLQPDGIESVSKGLVYMRKAQEGKPQYFEWQHLRLDGSTWDAEVTLNQIKYKGKAHLIVVIRDISERKRIDQALKGQHAFLMQIIENSPNYIFVRDRQSKYLLVNKSFAEVLNRPQEEIVGKTVNELNPHSLHAQRYTREDNEVMDTCQTLNYPIEEITFPDGKKRWLQVVKCPIILADGNVDCVLCIMTDVTELKYIENALREKEERYRGILEGQTELIMRWKLDGTSTYINDAFCQFFGIPPCDAVGKKYLTHIHKKNRLNVLTLGKMLTLQNPSTTFEQEVTLQKGEMRWLLWTIRAFFDTEGQIHELQSVGRDITDRKHAEEALLESEARWQFAIEGSGDAVYDWNAATDKLLNTHKLKAMIGFQDDEIGDDFNDWFMRIHPDDKESVEAVMKNHMSGQTAFYTSEYRIMCKDGTYKWIMDRGKVIKRSENGQPLRYVGTRTDITHIKHAERVEYEQRILAEALMDTAAALNSTLDMDHLIDRIFENVGRVIQNDAVNIMLVDENGIITRVIRDKRYQDFPSPESVQGVRLKDLPGLEWVAETGQPWIIPDVKDNSNWVSFSETHWIRSYMGVPINFKGRLFGFINLDCAIPNFYTQAHAEQMMIFANQVAIAMENARLYSTIQQELLERKQIEATMLASSKMANLGTLAAGVAHEMNSPLQVITGTSESLLRQIEKGQSIEPERLKNTLEMINRNAWRNAEIVRSLLTFAHASTDNLDLNDLNDVIRDALLLIEHQLQSWANISVVTDLGTGMHPLKCDRNQITQILVNLLTNARDAMPNGGVITIRTRYEYSKKRHVFQVNDTGVGIPEEIRDKIFTPFFTTKSLGLGTGLGLSNVMGIVQAYRGEIKLDTQLGKGTTFTLYFPEEE